MGGLFGGGPPAPPPAPSVPIINTTPTPMPVPDPDQQRRDALKDAARSQATQTTRASTIIGDDDSLGGP